MNHLLCFQCVEVEQKRMQSCILFMNLKKLNRLAHMRLKRGRDQTYEVKKIDILRLLLVFVLFARKHLMAFFPPGKAESGCAASSASEPAV